MVGERNFGRLTTRLKSANSSHKPLSTPTRGGSAISLALEVVDEFGTLNPYDRTVVPGSILKIEDDNFDPETKRQRQLYCFAFRRSDPQGLAQHRSRCVGIANTAPAV
jgi:hypothetical protein